jgi:hypothetical protein
LLSLRDGSIASTMERAACPAAPYPVFIASSFWD